MKTTFLWLSLLFCTISGSIHSQEVEWVTVKAGSGLFRSFHMINEKEFFVDALGIGATRALQHYTDFKQDAKKGVKLKADGKATGIFNYYSSDNKALLLMRSHSKKEDNIYYQFFDSVCYPVNDPVLLVKIPDIRGKSLNDCLKVIQSENKTKFAVEYAVPCADGEKEQFGYRIFDEKLRLIREGVYQSEYTDAEIVIDNVLLTNNGDLVFGFKTYEHLEDEKTYRYKGYEVQFLKADGNFKHELSIGEKNDLGNIALALDNASGILGIVGAYSTIKTVGGQSTALESGTDRMFYVMLNLETNKVSEPVFGTYTDEILFEGLSEKELNNVERQERRGSIAKELSRFVFREVKLLPDGGIVGSMEQHYIKETVTSSSKGASYNYYYYDYDVLVFKLNNGDNFDWIKKIPKRQVSLNDGGRYNGFSGYFTDTNYRIFFNDNIQNYLEDGTYDYDNEKIESMTLSKSKNVLAEVVFDLNTGDVQRKIFTSEEEVDAQSEPKEFMHDRINKTFILYFEAGSKDKFGVIRY